MKETYKKSVSFLSKGFYKDHDICVWGCQCEDGLIFNMYYEFFRERPKKHWISNGTRIEVFLVGIAALYGHAICWEIEENEYWHNWVDEEYVYNVYNGYFIIKEVGWDFCASACEFSNLDTNMTGEDCI